MTTQILVIGGLVLDISFDIPEWIEPNRAVHATQASLTPGGKGLNTALTSARLGGDVRLIACVGKDLAGNGILDNLRDEPLKLDWIQQYPSAQTTMVGLIVHEAIPSYIGAPDASRKVTRETVEKAIQTLNSQSIVVVNFEVEQAVIKFALTQAKSIGATTVFNPAPYFTTDDIPLDYLEQVDYLVLNRYEAQRITNLSNASSKEYGMALLDTGVKNVCLTLGENGSLFVNATETYTQSALPVNVIDTTGAGDSFLGAFVMGLSRDWNISKILNYATASASYTCTVHGTMPALPKESDLQHLLNQ